MYINIGEYLPDPLGGKIIIDYTDHAIRWQKLYVDEPGFERHMLSIGYGQ